MKSAVLVATAMAAALSMVTFGGASQAADEMEKCFGVAAAGKNDCKAGTHSCAGHSTVAADPASYIVVPKGTCEKINGGSLTPKA
jgi:uncharacterized membrane protein